MSLNLDVSLKNTDYEKFLQENTFTCDEAIEVKVESGVLKAQCGVDVFCDFTDKKYLAEVRQNFAKKESVFSFLSSLFKKEKIKMCDSTVGMGRDFFKFVLAGHEVVGFEQNPLIYSLVLDGAKRFESSDLKEELLKKFKHENFNYHLKFGEVNLAEDFDLIYYDPMFSDEGKKAAPKKSMQFLKKICEESSEENKLRQLEKFKNHADFVVYKCSKKNKGFPFKIKQEIKGKGFSYIVL